MAYTCPSCDGDMRRAPDIPDDMLEGVLNCGTCDKAFNETDLESGEAYDWYGE